MKIDRKSAEAAYLGLTLVISTAIGLAIGVVIDKRFTTQPLFTIIFIILGVVAGFWNILKFLKK